MLPPIVIYKSRSPMILLLCQRRLAKELNVNLSPAVFRKSKARHTAFHCMSCFRSFLCCRTPSTNDNSSVTATYNIKLCNSTELCKRKGELAHINQKCHSRSEERCVRVGNVKSQEDFRGKSSQILVVNTKPKKY